MNALKVRVAERQVYIAYFLKDLWECFGSGIIYMGPQQLLMILLKSKCYVVKTLHSKLNTKHSIHILLKTFLPLIYMQK